MTKITNEKNSTTVVLNSHREKLEKDLQILFTIQNPFLPRVWLEQQREIINAEDKKGEKKGMVAMLSFFPKLTNYKVNAEIVFLLDRSGSISAIFTKVQKALKSALKTIPKTCFFQVISFGTRYERMFPQSMRATSSAISKACSRIDDMMANMGGTDLFSPLKDELERPPVSGYARNLISLAHIQTLLIFLF